MKDDQSPVLTCPICQGHYKRRTQWQEVCSAVCRRRKWQLNMVKRILDQAYEKPHAELFAELEAKIKAGFRF